VPFLVFLALATPAVLAQDKPATGKLAQLVFFLDSTYTQESGTLSVSAMLGWRHTPGGSEASWTTGCATYGISRRVEARVLFPYLRVSAGSSYRWDGLGDSSLAVKIRVRDSGRSRIGVAIQPMLEMLGGGSLWAGQMGPGKYALALPVIAQRDLGRFALYAEAGYSTRRALFAGVGLPAALTSKLGLCANLTYSHATSNSPLNKQYGLARSRAEGGVSLWYSPSARLTLLANAARTITEMETNATGYMLGVGASYRFRIRSAD